MQIPVHHTTNKSTATLGGAKCVLTSFSGCSCVNCSVVTTNDQDEGTAHPSGNSIWSVHTNTLKCSVGYHKLGYMPLYICPDPQNVGHQE